MKKFCLILIALIVFAGCDQGQKMVAPVMTGNALTPEIPQTGVVEIPTDPVAEDAIEAVTFENVLDLEAGKTYKLRPLKLSVQAAGMRLS